MNRYLNDGLIVSRNNYCVKVDINIDFDKSKLCKTLYDLLLAIFIFIK